MLPWCLSSIVTSPKKFVFGKYSLTDASKNEDKIPDIIIIITAKKISGFIYYFIKQYNQI